MVLLWPEDTSTGPSTSGVVPGPCPPPTSSLCSSGDTALTPTLPTWASPAGRALRGCHGAFAPQDLHLALDGSTASPGFPARPSLSLSFPRLLECDMEGAPESSARECPSHLDGLSTWVPSPHPPRVASSNSTWTLWMTCSRPQVLRPSPLVPATRTAGRLSGRLLSAYLRTPRVFPKPLRVARPALPPLCPVSFQGSVLVL